MTKIFSNLLLNSLTVNKVAKDLAGQRFGKLKVLSISHKKRSSYWCCKCDCGSQVIIREWCLLNGTRTTCGCVGHKTNLKHGQSGRTRTKEYYTWCSMVGRCQNPNLPMYKRYGGRGITVCERWRNSYETFLSDLGKAPSKKHSIERINNDGNYEPGNCKWATNDEQQRNRQGVILVTHNNLTLPLSDWCNRLKLNRSTVRKYLNNGKTFPDIINSYKTRPHKIPNIAEVIIIKTFLKEGISHRVIAKEFLLGHQTVYKIAKNKTHKDIAA